MEDGVGDGGGHRNDGGLTDALGAERAIHRGLFHEHGLDGGHIQNTGNLVVEEVGISQPVVVEDHLFAERHADALDDGAVNLAFDCHGIDRDAHVLGSPVTRQLHLACVGVNLDVRHVGAKTRHPLVVAGCALPHHGPAGGHGTAQQIGHGHRAAGRALYPHVSLVQLHT